MGYRFTDLTTACQQDWRAYIEHDFVRQLGNATLPEASFRHYLKQDYLFLIHFARAYALAAYKSPTLADLRQAHEGLKAIVDVELGLHVGFCQEWGISEQELAELPEARATLAYTRYVLDTGNRGDLLDLHVALAPVPGGLRRNRQLAERATFHAARRAEPVRCLDRHVRRRGIPSRHAGRACVARYPLGGCHPRPFC